MREWVKAGLAAVALAAGCGDDCVRCGEAIDGGMADGGPQEFTVSNVETTCTQQGTHRGRSVPAIPFRPPGLPARVDTIRMVLQESYFGEPFNAICDHTTPFDVLLFTGDERRPPREPDDLVVLEVTGPEGGSESQVLTIELEEPVTLDSGEWLFVGLRLPDFEGEGPSQCVALCGVDRALPGDWTSATFTPPFIWSEAAVGTTPTRLLLEVDGELR